MAGKNIKSFDMSSTEFYVKSGYNTTTLLCIVFGSTVEGSDFREEPYQTASGKRHFKPRKRDLETEVRRRFVALKLRNEGVLRPSPSAWGTKQCFSWLLRYPLKDPQELAFFQAEIVKLIRTLSTGNGIPTHLPPDPPREAEDARTAAAALPQAPPALYAPRSATGATTREGSSAFDITSAAQRSPPNAPLHRLTAIQPQHQQQQRTQQEQKGTQHNRGTVGCDENGKKDPFTAGAPIEANGMSVEKATAPGVAERVHHVTRQGDITAAHATSFHAGSLIQPHNTAAAAAAAAAATAAAATASLEYPKLVSHIPFMSGHHSANMATTMALGGRAPAAMVVPHLARQQFTTEALRQRVEFQNAAAGSSSSSSSC